ncbi:MAG: leucine-rich repeat domain-containing protein [Clostridia bacterium]|nr:leucine-rich repeat domain-containing protein [Clostridia bacterium]
MKKILVLLIAVLSLFIIACDNDIDTDTSIDTDTGISALPNDSPELYEYKETGICYEVIGIKENREEIIISSSYNGKKVIGIGEKAFFGNTTVKKVSIPEGIRYINSKAFKDCKNLEEINFPATLTKLGEDAIFNCDKLKYESYQGCSYIGNWLMRLDNKEIDVLEIRENTVGIAPFAVYFAPKLRNVSIPNSVKYIGSHAFFACSFLRTINLGKGVEYIGEYAFANCSLFKNIDIGENIKDIKANAFYGCKGTITYMGAAIPVGFELGWNGECEILMGKENG